MANRFRGMVSFGLVLGLVLVTGCGVPGGQASTTTEGAANQTGNAPVTATSGSIAPGAMAPTFSLAQLNGNGNVSLKQLLGKQPIILNAWASWCGPCQREESDLLALAKQYQGKVTVIGVNMTSTDSLSGAKKFVSDYQVSYPVLLDTKGAFMDAYQVSGYPTTFLISKTGKIEVVHPGMLSKPQMQALFQQALGQA